MGQLICYLNYVIERYHNLEGVVLPPLSDTLQTVFNTATGWY